MAFPVVLKCHVIYGSDLKQDLKNLLDEQDLAVVIGSKHRPACIVVILWDDCNYIVIPATFISAASLFCIEEVGVLIEEPFPMLALDELCKAVNESIREAIGIQELVRAQLLNKKKGHCNEHSPNGRPLDSVL